jgi:hypothetical protein
MKILMTGHTSPVGKELFNHFSTTDTVVGISRTTGFDLSNTYDLEKVVELSKDFDHFINLANVGTSQTYLLSKIHRYWKDINKTGKILSFGSMATLLPYSLLESVNSDFDYIRSKLSLDMLHSELELMQLFGAQPYSVLIRFLNYGEKIGNRTNESSLNSQELVETVDFVLRAPTYISTINFRKT